VVQPGLRGSWGLRDLRGSKWPTSSSFQDISVAQIMQAMMVVASIRTPPHTPHAGLDTGVTMPVLAATSRRVLCANPPPRRGAAGAP
jgi:hypothetical protein